LLGWGKQNIDLRNITKKKKNRAHSRKKETKSRTRANNPKMFPIDLLRYWGKIKKGPHHRAAYKSKTRGGTDPNSPLLTTTSNRSSGGTPALRKREWGGKKHRETGTPTTIKNGD